MSYLLHRMNMVTQAARTTTAAAAAASAGQDDADSKERPPSPSAPFAVEDVRAVVGIAREFIPEVFFQEVVNFP